MSDSVEYEYIDPSELPELFDIDGAEIAMVIKDGVTYKINPELLKGAEGKNVELQLTATELQWRLIGGEWQTLTTLESISGEDGEDGKQVEFQKSLTHIQWRFVGDVAWIDFVLLSDLKGDDGREVELQKSATHVQWRYVGEVDWIDLIALVDIDGEDGDDGKQVEFQKSLTHIQWRFVGDVAWIDLVELADLKGEDGLGAGDMLAATYDPTNKAGDAFDRTKHHGEQPQSSITDLVTDLAGKAASDHNHTKSDVGLDQVDNTPDADKEVSTSQQTALDLKAPLVSPALTGTPTTSTPLSTANNTQMANTAWVKALIDTLLGGVAGGGDTLFELYAEILNNDTAIDTLNAAIGNKLNKTFDNIEDAAAARTALGLGAVAILASIGIANVDGLTDALAGKAASSHAALHESGGDDEIEVTLDMVSDLPNYSGVTEKPQNAGALTIDFTDAAPIMIYTTLVAAITSLTLNTIGAVFGKKVTWYIKGDFAIDFTGYIKAESSENYGGVYARIDLECGVNPTDGSIVFWYNIINQA